MAQSPDDALNGSWVELEGLVASASQTEADSGAQDSPASLLQGELERILLEAQLECERSSQTESPPQVVTPRTSGSPKPASEGSSSTDCVTIQSDENERRVSAEWVWDWSSRPENLPPKITERFALFLTTSPPSSSPSAVPLLNTPADSPPNPPLTAAHLLPKMEYEEKKTVGSSPSVLSSPLSPVQCQLQPLSQLQCQLQLLNRLQCRLQPLSQLQCQLQPLSPFQSRLQPLSLLQCRLQPLSRLQGFVFHHPKQSSSEVTEVMKKGLFSSDVLLILLPSLIASHALTLGLGIYIGKRLASSSTSTL
ncbi:BCL2/adenovirus E1B 19 kDa protein-interacting protein 3-like [Carassius carassius]|uniref:BCL2/adenovirus E1B 19 kDa protein-interacting protein 3-like n=1 Tax=Carassius carassius TaxID=217509 RepID=UPI002868BE75|nr:BCL2/adenovirus E1B 19 kDa protein-interacting protein 3-like [Carassius carassius]